jgi:hypothetical protein
MEVLRLRPQRLAHLDILDKSRSPVNLGCTKGFLKIFSTHLGGMRAKVQEVRLISPHALLLSQAHMLTCIPMQCTQKLLQILRRVTAL